ncbi:MAG: amidohydrolase family protein [Acidobacteriota bacterium]|nr:amidohydrolase family protein [Blastocatellia bacterium]MDW8238300.1 amidohydrolase family protein [Acidobacteriota bacterium]
MSRSEQGFALVGGTIIDGCGGEPLQDGVVVVEGNRIVAVGPRHCVPINSEVQRVDATGKFILPGLIDIHVHYQGWMGELFLSHGVTTVKDMGNDVEWISSISADVNEGKVRGPRIYYVGNGLDAPPPFREHHVGLQSPEAAKKAVELLYERGAAAIKVREKITPGLLQAVCERAHELGIRVTGHIAHTDAYAAALAGIDGLEHATGVVDATAVRTRRSEPGLSDLQQFIDELKAFSLINLDRVDKLIELLVREDVALIPTMANWWRMAMERRKEFASEDAIYADNPALAYIPPMTREFLTHPLIFEVQNADDLAQVCSGFEKLLVVLQRHYHAGGKVLAGSDTIYSVPGVSLLRELIVLVDAGFTPMQTLLMATRDNAAFLGKADELGTIEPGKLADIVVVSADPLEKIDHIRQIDLVIKDGQIVDRSYHADYSIATPEPKLTRPLWLERQLASCIDSL